MRTSLDYSDLIKAHLPRGLLWDMLEADPIFSEIIGAFADELALVEARSLDIIAEADPRQVKELMPEWQAYAGLPEPCGQAPSTLIEQRNALLNKLTAIGGQSRQYFIDVAAKLGFAITLTEFAPLRCGFQLGGQFAAEEAIFTLQINAALNTVFHSQYGQMQCGDQIRSWGNESLECALNQIVHAHMTLLFSYS